MRAKNSVHWVSKQQWTALMLPLLLTAAVVLAACPIGVSQIELRSAREGLLQQKYIVGPDDRFSTINYDVYEGGFYWNMTAECDWVSFITGGHDICVYGGISVDQGGKAVDFFFTDQVGYDIIVNGQDATGQTLLLNRTTGMSWNTILPHRFHDNEVATWYAFVSIGGITDPLVPYRTGTLFIGQDLTPPSVTIDINGEIAGTASFTVTFMESNCNLSQYRVWVGDKLITYDSFKTGQKSAAIPFSFDTSGLSDGPCTIRVWVCDTGGAERSYYSYPIVNNIPDTSTSTMEPPDYFAQFVALFVFLGGQAADNINSWVWRLGLLLAIVDAVFKYEKAKMKSEHMPWNWVVLSLLLVGLFVFFRDIGAFASVVLPIVSLSLTGIEVGGTWWSRRTAKQRKQDRIVKESLERREDEARDKRITQLEHEAIEKDARIAELEAHKEQTTKRIEALDQSKENPDAKPRERAE